jgi:hypothetical protein
LANTDRGILRAVGDVDNEPVSQVRAVVQTERVSDGDDII